MEAQSTRVQMWTAKAKWLKDQALLTAAHSNPHSQTINTDQHYLITLTACIHFTTCTWEPQRSVCQ